MRRASPFAFVDGALDRADALRDDPDTLAALVLEQEHRLYPLAIRWFAEGRLRLEGDRVRFDGEALAEPLRLEDLTAPAG